MKNILSQKVIPWILPPIGFVLGLLFAFLFLYGLFETWHYIGKPDERIVTILGVHQEQGLSYKLYVSTESGKIYSLNILSSGSVILPTKLTWKEEKKNEVSIEPAQDWGPEFISFPPLFRVLQYYEFEYPAVEAVGEVKYALASDGNLWMWHYAVGGYMGAFFMLFPILGFLGGVVIALIQFVLFTRKKIIARQTND